MFTSAQRISQMTQNKHNRSMTLSTKENPFFTHSLRRTLPRIRINPKPKPIMVLLAPVPTPAQLRLESLLASLIINRLLLLPVAPNLNRPVQMVPSVVTQIRRPVLKLTEGFAPLDARVDDGRVAAADVGARLALVVAIEGWCLARAGLLPVGAGLEGFGRLDGLACYCGAGRVDIVFDFLDDVAGVAKAVEGVEAYVALAVAAESFEEAGVRGRWAGVGEVGEGEGADHGWDDG
jgi:hypothetical protein